MGCPVVHFEIGCPDTEQARAFYSALFGWRVAGDGPSAVISTESDRGIPGHVTSLGHEPHNYINVYVQVDDIREYLARAVALGGRALIGPLDVPDGSGAFAWLQDPGGTTIGLWKPT